MRQGDVKSERVADVVERVKSGRLALIALHSAHWSQPFVRLMEERALADAGAKLSPETFKAGLEANASAMFGVSGVYDATVELGTAAGAITRSKAVN